MDEFDLVKQAEEDKMSNAKAQTLQQRFGFNDGDMRTPKHDEIMLWLNDNIRQVLTQLHFLPSQWSQKEIDDLADAVRTSLGKDLVWHGFEFLPEYPEPEIKVVWEVPITTHSKFIVGFIDLLAIIKQPYLNLTNVKWRSYGTGFDLADRSKLPELKVGQHPEEVEIVFEIKTTIPSLGELIRQIRMYQEFKKVTYVVVCPDDKYSSALKSQGIWFVRYPN